MIPTSTDSELLPSAIELYLRTHRDPELSGAEQRTAQRLAGHLAVSGFDVTDGVGGHGVVGVLRNGPGPVVALRTELDALPVREQTDLPYASTATAIGASGREVPVAHACGHDLHLAAVASAARTLARDARSWQGTLMVIGQPAEETLTGAAAMLADGLYERFERPDVVLAQHAAPLPSGMVAHAIGVPVNAAAATVRVIVHGRGGHAATPHLAVDPVLIAASIVVRLQAVVSREIAPGDPATVTAGALHAGETGNVIPDQARIELSVRALSESSLDRALHAVRRIVEAECAASDAREPQITVTGRVPPNRADDAVGAAVREAHRTALGTERVAHWPPSLAADDFALLGPAGAHLHGHAGVRTAYWMLGVVGRAQWTAAPGATAAEKLAALPANHAPDFRPDPRSALPAGISALTIAAHAVLHAAASRRAGDSHG
jgi:amidohydrolase